MYWWWDGHGDAYKKSLARIGRSHKAYTKLDLILIPRTFCILYIEILIKVKNRNSEKITNYRTFSRGPQEIAAKYRIKITTRQTWKSK